ncbi:uncharacterized protein LOC143248087 [Tachypleus tridentatus]|uniref:uncharacterized protein LOC143248087 n=1 Tax=Tachypleus tridentatus TaxID=6853 RepID=UPI003FD463AD
MFPNKIHFIANYAGTTRRQIFMLPLGKLLLSLKKTIKHALAEDHCSAVASQVLKKDMSTAAVNVYVGCKGGIQAQMATLLVQTKEAIPTVKFHSLLSLQVFNGVTSLKKLQTQSQSGTESFIYTHSQSLDDMYSALNHVVQDEMQADFWALPFPFLLLKQMKQLTQETPLY